MNRRTTARGKVLVVTMLATTGLLAYAAPGLAAETGSAPPLTTVAAAPAGPGDATGEDPDDERSVGGWRGFRGGTEDDRPSRDDSAGDSGSRDSGDRKSNWRDELDGASSESDDGEFATGESEQKQRKAAQKAESSKKQAAKKSSKAAKQKAAKKAAARKKAAKKARQKALARKMAQQKAQQKAQQRRARSDDGRSGGSIDSMRQAILDLTNRARASAGCGRLRYSEQLERSAQAHANDMSAHNYMSHTSRGGRNSDQRIRSTGFNGDKTGENLGNGFSSPEAVFRAWMNSPSHRRNIVDCKFKILGVGYASSGGYWVQHFGG